ncbi:MAG: 3-methyl-2-oxobutanoate hydroxymethyltransferase [Geodermatophilaceae bacterium]|nr:3-methyl-2-oxobutanoate hydroxymethyltransferase [Geodermatophilaceae bacterium]
MTNAHSAGEASVYGAVRPARVRIPHLQALKESTEPWPMLTAYDQYTAAIFDQAGIPVLLVGDSAANNVYGYPSSLGVTMEELLPLVRAVVGATSRSLVVADLPFGSYESSPEQALASAVRMMKEAGAHAVKLEGGVRVAAQILKISQAGVPVMGHIGFTPQSEHRLGGYKIQGRGAGADQLLADAQAVQEAGAFAVVLEMVPGELAAEVTKALTIPTIGIGAGPDCDAQVLVWQDMAGLNTGKVPRFVKQYADLDGVLRAAATAYAADVRGGTFPGSEHTYG